MWMVLVYVGSFGVCTVTYLIFELRLLCTSDRIGDMNVYKRCRGVGAEHDFSHMYQFAVGGISSYTCSTKKKKQKKREMEAVVFCNFKNSLSINRCIVITSYYLNETS